MTRWKANRKNFRGRNLAFRLLYQKPTKDTIAQRKGIVKRTAISFRLGLLASLALGLAAFSNALFNGFVYDDLRLLYGNPFLTLRPSVGLLFSSEYFAWSRQGSYRPVVTLSYLWDGAFWGGNPLGYHLTNLVLHCGNVALLACVMRVLGASDRAAFLGSAMFASHPVFCEVVAIPSYREDLLALFFCLGSVGCLAGWNAGPDEDLKTGGWWGRGGEWPVTAWPWRLASALCYFAALLAKEVALGFFVFLGLVEWLRRESAAPPVRAVALRSAAPWLPHLAATLVYLPLRFGLFGKSNELTPDYLGGSFALNGVTMGVVFLSYVPMLFFPVHLKPDYPVHPVSSWAEGGLGAAGVALLVALGAWVAAGSKSNRWARLGLGWSVAFLIPVMNLYPIANPKAERYLYLPAAGLISVAGVLADWGLTKLVGRAFQRAALAGGLFILVCWVSLARLRVAEIRDSLVFWKHAVTEQPDSVTARRNLGVEYQERGQLDEAWRQFWQARELDPSRAIALNLAWLDVKRAQRAGGGGGGKGSAELPRMPTYEEAVEAAIQEYEAALRDAGSIPGERALLEDALAVLWRKAGRLEEALEGHRRAEALDPFADEFHLHHGVTLHAMGQFEAAIEEYRKALAFFPERPETHYNLGTAFEAMNQLEKGRKAFEAALRLRPDYPEAQAGLAAALMRMGRTEDSLEHFRAALRWNPERLDWRYNYLQALHRAGRVHEAQGELDWLSRVSNLPVALQEGLERIRAELQAKRMP